MSSNPSFYSDGYSEKKNGWETGNEVLEWLRGNSVSDLQNSQERTFIFYRSKLKKNKTDTFSTHLDCSTELYDNKLHT